MSRPLQACYLGRFGTILRHVEPARAIVYTAIFGDYDTLKQPPGQDMACNFVCFTDDAASLGPSGAWRVIEVRRDPDEHPRMQAKWFKLMSHRIFPGGRLTIRYDFLSVCRKRCDAVIWIDGSIRIKSSSFVREFADHIGPSGWALFIHPDRDCIYDELVASSAMPKYDGQPMAEQVAHYRALGHPEHSGLFACGVIARSGRNDPRLIMLNEAWWQEIRRWSHQDQLSLPYLLRKLHLGVDLVNHDLWRNDWFDWVPHNSEA